MKILYLGTVCNEKKYNKLLERCKVKPSAAPMVYESALMEGFRDNRVDLSVASFPIVPAFPKGKVLGWGNQQDVLSCGYKNTWLAAINVTGLKQLSLRISSARYLRQWFRKNAGEAKAVILYSIYEPIAGNVLKYCKKYQTPCYAIIPDLPRDMYSNMRISKLKKWMSEHYVKNALKLQGKFDGYVYLTEDMAEEINPVAPYTVVEGIFDAKNAKPPKCEAKEAIPAIMYAGALHEKYGIRQLLEGFLAVADRAQLWLFGYGDYVQEIQTFSEKYPSVRYFGQISHDEVLQYERRASLLVNLRSPEDMFTQYSFPSKTIEYMGSGTPLLTTKLPGIPKEYFSYCYSISKNSVEEISRAFGKIISMPEEERCAFGKIAQKFVLEHKNPQQQALKILKLFEDTRREV